MNIIVLCYILGVVLVLLKLFGIIKLSWLLTLTPLLIAFLAFAIILIGTTLYSKIKESLKEKS